MAAVADLGCGLAMSKRASGTPRRPRNPVARAVRTPLFKQRVIPDKRWQEHLKGQAVAAEADVAEGKPDDLQKAKD